jgi:hypothetical protein
MHHHAVAIARVGVGHADCARRMRGGARRSRRSAGIACARVHTHTASDGSMMVEHAIENCHGKYLFFTVFVQEKSTWENCVAQFSIYYFTYRLLV